MTNRDIVARAASYLDRRYPGWYHEVNPSRLNLTSATDCVLGQLAERITGDRLTSFHSARRHVRLRHPLEWLRVRRAFFHPHANEYRWSIEILERRRADREANARAEAEVERVRVIVPFNRELVDA